MYPSVPPTKSVLDVLRGLAYAYREIFLPVLANSGEDFAKDLLEI